MQVRIANCHHVRVGQVWEREIIDLQFILILAGTFFYRDQQVSVQVEAGQVLWIEPGVQHAVGHVADSAPGRIAGIHGELTTLGTWRDRDYRCDPLPLRVITADAEISAGFQRCAQVFEGYHRQRQALVTAEATAVVLRMSERWGGTEVSQGHDQRMRAMLSHVRTHAVRGCDRHDLARTFGLSPEHVNALFRQQINMTPGEVVHRERCRIAFQALHESGVSVAEAAALAGYEDPFHFSRVFRRLYGMAPSFVR